MSTPANAPQRALVLGSGAVGSAVVRELREHGVETTFTFHQNEGRATALATETGATATRVDASDAEALVALAERHRDVEVLLHCAGILEAAALPELSTEAFDHAHAVNTRSAFVLSRELGGHMAERERGGIWLVGGMDRAQSLPLPVAYAASQGALAAMTMALAKELGPRGVAVNMVALGLLDEGLSLELDTSLRDDFLAYSALRRFGTPAEAARGIVWLALHARYLSGKVVPLNGGI